MGAVAEKPELMGKSLIYVALAEGLDAHVTVIDPERPVVVDPKTFRSKSRNTPFAGWELRGAPVMTIVGGRVVHDGRDPRVSD